MTEQERKIFEALREYENNKTIINNSYCSMLINPRNNPDDIDKLYEEMVQKLVNKFIKKCIDTIQEK